MFSDWIWVQNVIFPLVGMGMGMTVLFMIYRTVHKVIDRRSRKGITAEEVEEIRAHLEEVRAELGGQIIDLQERMDFTERALVSGQPSRGERGT